MVPLCMIAQKPGHAVGTEQELLPSDLSWVLLTGGRRSVNKVIGLGFGKAETAPRLAVKFARSESEDDPLEREAATLRTLERTVPQLRGVPQLLFVGRRVGRVALGETVVFGQPVLGRLDQSSLAAVAEDVTSWLIDLARSVETEPRASWWERLVEGPAREFERMFVSVLDPDEAARTREVLSTLRDLPVVCEHRDCSPWNVLHDDCGDLAVVDWESSEPRGLPALDLVYFLTYAALVVEGAFDDGAAETYARTLDPDSVVGAIVQECEQRYCERVGLDAEQLRPLRLLCWTVHAQSEYRLLEQDTAGPPARKALAASLFLSFWRQELRRGTGLTPSSGRGA
jgi:aminoglycoside phosphotransferase (APT) family kinase protein